jgi:predicted  nucleic acid-binding Zn-ribbon protein
VPHQCTNCGHTFDDGSKEMLSGCPECGGTKFQFHPDEVPDEPTGEAAPPDDGGGVVGKAAETVRDFVGDREPPDRSSADRAAPDGADGGAPTDTDRSGASGGTDATDAAPAADDPVESAADAASEDAADGSAADADEGPPAEDTAQANARSELVDSDELPDPDEADVVEPPTDDKPDMEELREELNSQFESIRIVDRGQYELNLMELYDREEYIIALQENGRYVIEVPDAWHGDEPGADDE